MDSMSAKSIGVDGIKVTGSDSTNADKAVETLKAYGEDAVVLGELVEGNDGVIFE